MDNKPNKPVAIILPCYNSGKHLKHAIESILRTKYPYKLILVESESTDGTAKLCDDYAQEYDFIWTLHTKKEGITKAINKGIDMAGDLDVYLTQDDVILPRLYKRDWLTILNSISKKDDCGIVTTLNAGGIDTVGHYLKGYSWTGTWSLYIPRKVINLIGKLDEKFSPGPGDDIDFSYRVDKTGLKRFCANFWVDHHRMTENFNDNIEEIKNRNAKYFKKKHGL